MTSQGKDIYNPLNPYFSYDIKPTRTPPRKTLVSQIVAKVKRGENLSAMALCEYGKLLKYAEAFLGHFYMAFDKQEAAMRGKRYLNPFLLGQCDSTYTDEELNALAKKVKEYEETICSIFLQAVKHHDGKMIMELARGVWFFKDKRLFNHVPADRERGVLISLKMMLEEAGQKIPIRTLAEFLAIEAKAHGRKFNPEADGYSTLRRKCRQLDFPLAESRKTGRKMRSKALRGNKKR